MKRVLLLTEHLFVSHHVRLETALAKEMPEIMIDRHMMEQVLMNLILNAIQAMRAGGVLDHSHHGREGQLSGPHSGFRLRDFPHRCSRGSSIRFSRRRTKARAPGLACR